MTKAGNAHICCAAARASTAGAATSRNATAGTATAGTTTVGAATAGIAMAGTTMAGTTATGTAMAGAATAGNASAGATTAGNATAGATTAGAATAGIASARVASVRTARVRAALCALLLAGGLTGCRAGYLSELAYEQARYLASARPIAELIAAETDPTRRRRLELVVEARSFAKEAGLEVGGSYTKVSDSSRTRSFEVVTAAYADRVEPYTWWYPVIGRIPYRGYFERAAAEKFAASLREQGLDTLIVQAAAYSTLGWFDDPLPSALLERDDLDLVTVVLHELVHQTLFVKGEVAFNETLANAASMRLAAQFFAGRGDAARAEEAGERRDRWLARGELLDGFAERLTLFLDGARRHRLALKRTLAGRGVLYEELRAQLAALDVAGGADAAAAETAESGLTDNAAFLAAYRYAKHASEIDAFIAARPSVKRALDDLRRLTAHGVDPYEALSR